MRHQRKSSLTPPSRRLTHTQAMAADPPTPPPQWTAEKVRKQFIDFFATKEHTFYKSSPVVPHNDPTLLFINGASAQTCAFCR